MEELMILSIYLFLRNESNKHKHTLESGMFAVRIIRNVRIVAGAPYLYMDLSLVNQVLHIAHQDSRDVGCISERIKQGIVDSNNLLERLSRCNCKNECVAMDTQ